MLSRLLRKQASAMQCTCMQQFSLQHARKQLQPPARQQCCRQLATAVAPTTCGETAASTHRASGASHVHCGIAGFSRLHTAGSHPQFQLRNAAGSAAAPSRGGQHPAGCGPYAAMRGVPRGGLCKGLPLDATLSHAPASRFPFVEPLTLQTGERVDSARVIEAMSQFVAPARLARIDRCVTERTFNVLPIVEGVYDMGNLAAVTRSADALGLGALHIINSSGAKYKQSARHSAGAEKWLDVRMWSSAADCLASAKAAGFQVVVTHLRADAIDVKDVDWTRPTAIVLGNEREGVSQEVLDVADQCAVIPMVGMVESLNVSVAAALMLNEARRGRLQALGYHGDLTREEQETLRAVMLLRHQGKSDQILSHLLKRPAAQWQTNTRWYREVVRNGVKEIKKEFAMDA